MKQDDPQTPPALQALCERAGEQAARHRLGAAAPAIGAARSPRWRWLLVGLAGGCGLLTLAVVAAQFRDQAASPSVAPSAVVAAPPSLSQALPANAAVASPGDPVRWQGGEAVVGVDAAPRVPAAPPSGAGPAKPSEAPPEPSAEERASQPDGSC